MLITTVTRKASPQPMATSLKRFGSNMIRAEISGDEMIISEVNNSIIAVTASHRLISKVVRGKFMFINS